MLSNLLIILSGSWTQINSPESAICVHRITDYGMSSLKLLSISFNSICEKCDARNFIHAVVCGIFVFCEIVNRMLIDALTRASRVIFLGTKKKPCRISQMIHYNTLWNRRVTSLTSVEWWVRARRTILDTRKKKHAVVSPNTNNAYRILVGVHRFGVFVFFRHRAPLFYTFPINLYEFCFNFCAKIIHKLVFYCFRIQPAAVVKWRATAAAPAIVAAVAAVTVCQINGANEFAVRWVALGFLAFRHDSLHAAQMGAFNAAHNFNCIARCCLLFVFNKSIVFRSNAFGCFDSDRCARRKHAHEYSIEMHYVWPLVARSDLTIISPLSKEEENPRKIIFSGNVDVINHTSYSRCQTVFQIAQKR